MNAKSIILIIIAIITLILLIFSMVYIFNRKTDSGISENPAERKACPAIAKICPDGSAAEMDPKNCEFKACQEENSEGRQDDIIGGDRDEHGCIGSAGYQWCEEKNKCLRIWEEGCGR